MGVLYARVAGAWVPVGGGGSGADEVSVGPDQPADTFELWVDTDETAPLPDDSRWNTAWGMVAKGTLPGGSMVASAGAVLGTLTATMVAGRRYRFTFFLRAMDSSGNGAMDLNLCRDGAAIFDAWALSVAAYDSASMTWLVDGDSSPHTWTIRVGGTNGAPVNVYLDSASSFTLEDVGPISGAAPALMTVTDRWNTAWGLAAQGTILGSGDMLTVANNTPLATMVFRPLTGRRYKISFFVRAWQMGTGPLSFNIQLMRDGAQFTVDSPWVAVLANYESTMSDWLMAGNDVTSTFEVRATNVAAGGAYLYRTSSFFIIEDIGPVSGAVPVADPTPPWIAMGGLINGWVAGNPAPSYRKVGDMVQFRGLISRSTALTAPSTSYFGNLPVGYRPSVGSNLPCMSVGSDMWGAASLLLVAANGDVAVIKTAQSPTNPHVGTQWEFQFSVTP